MAAAVLVPVAAGSAAAQAGDASGGAVVIANGWSPPDVGAAAPLAGRLGAAVLYASKGELGEPTIDALEELNPSRVLLMGGTAALTPDVQSQVRRTLPGATVERFAGTDRVDTAAKAALSEPAVPVGQPAVIANGWSPPDVGTAAPLAASLGGSVLFTQRGSLGDSTVAALRRLAPSRVVIVGGLAAVGADIESRIGSIVPGAIIERLSGTDRVETAALGIDLTGVSLGGPVVLANGWSAPDVGIAAPLAGTLSGSVLLTERTKLGKRTAEALEDFSPSQIILIGGSEQFAEAVDADLERFHPGIPRINISGADRTATAALAALFGVQFSAEQQRFEEAVATITPGEADCDAAPQLDLASIEVVESPADLNDPTTPLTVAEVVRIAGGCALVDYVALDGRTVTDIRNLLADRPDVFAVGEPLRGFELLHETDPETDPHDRWYDWYGTGSDDLYPGSSSHYNGGAGEQWHLPQQYMSKLWGDWITDPDHQIAVAVIDSGVDTSHPDLRGQANAAGQSSCHVTDSWDTDPRYNNDSRLSPGGHGTHVAGIIAAKAANGGIAGVAPEATIIPVNIWSEILDISHRGPRSCQGVLDEGLVEALVKALNRGANVINMSFGRSWTVRPQDDACGGPDQGDSDRFRTEEVPIVRDKIERILGRVLDPNNCDAFRLVLEIANAKGVVNVAGAGNCGVGCDATDPATGTVVGRVPNAFGLPAGYDNSVIAVAAVDTQGNRAQFSTVSHYVDIAAPGVSILSSVPVAKPGTYDFEAWQGTSMAAPFISGVVAHMLNRYPDAQPWQVRRALADTARYPTSTGPDTEQNRKEYGHGIVQPREAILRLGELVDPDRTSNRISNLRVTGRTCAFGDDTSSCADPVPLSLQPKFAASAYPSQRWYTIEVPRDVDHISVKADYDGNGRPRAIDYFPPDNERQVAGSQFSFSADRNETTLTIWLPNWHGQRNDNPYQLTFVRAKSSDRLVLEFAHFE